MNDRSLDSLSSAFYVSACEWVARVTARGVAVMIVQTSRTATEHAANLAAGTSGTSFSLHLPRRLRVSTLKGLPEDELGMDAEKADAMDIAPYEIYQAHGPDKLNWNADDPAFGIIGEEAERVGLRWGGRWRFPRDPGHAELLLPVKLQYIAEERSRPWPYPKGQPT